MTLSKRELRRSMRERLSAISEDIFERESQRLSLRLLKLLSDLESKHQKKLTIGAFSPELKEPFWNLEVNKRFGLQLAFPRKNDSGAMSFFKARLDELVVGEDFGVKLLLPPKSLEVVPDVLLVPGLAFDKCGARLGRGKGFYDSYLANFSGLSIGIAFELQIVSDVPTESHDRSLNLIVTERETYDSRVSQEHI